LKRAFNLITAVFMILLVSGLGILTVKYVKISARHFADSYVREQAELFLDSVIESTLLKIEGIRRQPGRCPEKFTFISPKGRFEANVTIVKYFMYQGLDNEGKPTCDNVEAIYTPESHGYLLLDINLSTISGSQVVNPLFIHKRTLQRP